MQFSFSVTPPPQVSGSAPDWRCTFCVWPLKAAILCHMTPKLLVQTKDNEMYKCIKFRVLIS